MPDFSELYRSCSLCPRRCGVDRFVAQGFCGEGSELRIAFAGIHRGEEPPITGTGGSGTIFVSGCNLGCAFCQNWQISHNGDGALAIGRAVSADEFAAICLTLEKAGAGNINIVTGSHVIPAIANYIDSARAAGLHIPVLWNTSSYETPEALELLRGRINIFLPDLKTLDSNIAARFFNASDYPQTAQAAILKMIAMVDKVDSVIIRHLILPGYIESTKQVLRWFAENAQGKALLSLMTQYTPVSNRSAALAIPGSFVSEPDYETVLGWLAEFGIDDGFCQELVTGSDWLPDFNRSNPFSSDLSEPIWHYKDGLLKDKIRL